MIARPRTATATTLPASLVLTPRELKQYRRYQSQNSILPAKSHGRLPTATEYADFQSWLAKRDSGYLSDTPLADIACYVERASEKREEKGKASVCGHALHPTHKDKAERCPVCLVDAHITYMKALTVALEAAGVLVKQRWEAMDQESPALQAWYAGKLALIKEISRLESLAQDEHDYDFMHKHARHTSQAASEVKTATQALEMYWDSMEAKPTMMQAPRRKRAGTVDFCPETSFERGRDQLYFWRKSPRYEAGGKYASSSEEGDDEEPQEAGEEQTGNSTNTPGKVAVVLDHSSREEDEQSDGETNHLEDDDEEEDDVDEDSDSDEEEDEMDDETEVDGSYVVFEYEEVVVQGAEFVVFED